MLDSPDFDLRTLQPDSARDRVTDYVRKNLSILVGDVRIRVLSDRWPFQPNFDFAHRAPADDLTVLLKTHMRASGEVSVVDDPALGHPGRHLVAAVSLKPSLPIFGVLCTPASPDRLADTAEALQSCVLFLSAHCQGQYARYKQSLRERQIRWLGRVASAPTAHEMFRRITQEGPSNLRGFACSVLLHPEFIDDGAGTAASLDPASIYLIATTTMSDPAASAILGTRYEPGDGLTGWSLKYNVAVWVSNSADPEAYRRAAGKALAAAGLKIETADPILPLSRSNEGGVPPDVPRQVIVAPIQATRSGQPLGILRFVSAPSAEFSDNDYSLVLRLASILGSRLEVESFYRLLSRSLSLLSDRGRSLENAHAAVVSAFVAAKGCSIFRTLPESTDTIALVATTSAFPHEQYPTRTYQGARGVTGWVNVYVPAGTVMNVADIQSEEALDNAFRALPRELQQVAPPRWSNSSGACETDDPGPYMAVPLVGEDAQRLGVLRVVRRRGERAFTKGECEVVKSLAQQLSTMLRFEVVLDRARGRYLSDMFPAGRRVDPTEDMIVTPGLEPAFKLAGRIALSDISVLIRGETGVGKEAIAVAIHRGSGRTGPLFKINCAALVESLLEAELFGIDDKVASGVSQRPGLIEQADQGTLFLDEIGHMSLSAQSRLLRVVENRELTRVGGRNTIKIDVRIVAATNANLEEMIERREFLPDLYHRLAFKLDVPRLRERVADIRVLAAHFLAAAAKRSNKTLHASIGIPGMFLTYPWPGNVRELRNVIDVAVALAGDVVREQDLEQAWSLTIAPGTLKPLGTGLTRPDVTALARRLSVALGSDSISSNAATALADHLIGHQRITKRVFRKLSGSRNDTAAGRKLKKLVHAQILAPTGKGGGREYTLRLDVLAAE